MQRNERDAMDTSMTWKDYLTDAEIRELDEIKTRKIEGQRQFKRIYDRCWRRARKACDGGARES